ncbi:gluconate 2-dehydrogenase subunit 3 family protein [Paraglaciecola aquimarina]|uniref:Gluconate 2-dehydrogenase subunit 3 family protein n=1 Tax=Paraglaciecola aquimarina TaxID=1235557 RepID=A0ABU3SY93_9ALTE|nr:gluconate 2-dehydrogenase subunit 3 family protein [Paraglaciecola aquimarina]MDU0354989.1 gluconate 2-dehydrogenase subunit 3 family protein [Paraglaciecola aquimarina]
MQHISISRRVFIGAAMYIVTAPILASTLNKQTKLAEIKVDGQFYSAHELTVLTDIAEIMIPKTDTIGATDAQVISVLDGLMMTWAGSKTKQQFKTCIQQIGALAKDTHGQGYLALPLHLRQQLIEQLDISAFANKKTQLSSNYRRLKEMVFHIFYTSEQANPDFILIPGEYYGNLTKQQLAKVNSGIRL